MRYILEKIWILKKILFTVTNELNYDQRMQRICTTLQENGYHVKLIGREDRHSTPLSDQIFQQKRLRCFLLKGPLFYAEYNIRLFCYLLFQKMDAVCAIDLDTILPVYFVSFFRRKKRVYDAHEFFTEQKEIVTRPKVQAIWLAIERFTVPKFRIGYTVNQSLSNLFLEKYGVSYQVIRNFSRKTNNDPIEKSAPFLLVQGCVNEGRGFEFLIPAMKHIEMPLHIYGSGNFDIQLQDLIKENEVSGKVFVHKKKSPSELRKITGKAYLGILLMDPLGLNNYYSLANRFTDYMMAGIPQICVDYPEYHAINSEFHFAELIPDIKSPTIVKHVNKLIQDKTYHQQLCINAKVAQSSLCWEQEEKKLLLFYQHHIPNHLNSQKDE